MFSNFYKTKFLCLVTAILIIPGVFAFWPFQKSKTSQQYSRTLTDEKSTNTAPENAEIIIKDLILKEIEKQKKLEVIVNAGEGKILNSTDKIECKNITCALKNKSIQIADLHANDAMIQKNTKNVFLSGATIGHIFDITIQGRDIKFDYSNQTLSTNKESTYSHKNFTLSARRSDVDLKQNKIVMSNGVKSEILNSSAGNYN